MVLKPIQNSIQLSSHQTDTFCKLTCPGIDLYQWTPNNTHIFPNGLKTKAQLHKYVYIISFRQNDRFRIIVLCCPAVPPVPLDSPKQFKYNILFMYNLITLGWK